VRIGKKEFFCFAATISDLPYPVKNHKKDFKGINNYPFWICGL
jgi:hypothetical protein